MVISEKNQLSFKDAIQVDALWYLSEAVRTLYESQMSQSQYQIG